MPILLLVAAAVACEPVDASEGGGSGAGAGSSRAADLGDCPQLRRGQADPIGGRDCVRALQHALRENGYSGQQETGVFGPQTESNVRDYQRSHQISPVTGVVGPKTRAALAGTSVLGALPLPPVTPSSYSSRSFCGDSVCTFYLRRGVTGAYSRAINAHPRIAAVATGAVLLAACRLLVIKIATAVCGLVSGSYAQDVEDDLHAAARQGACLRVSVGLLPGWGGTWKLLDSGPYNGPRCSD
ncbi:MAG TPA: peptidoglycan-binding domain-containing protein [Mycobacteriales bacterium]